MKFKKLIICGTITSILGLSACGGGNYSRINEKQRTPSDIKISHLNIENQSIELRFEYRTYDERTLDEVDCKIEFNANLASTSILKKPAIKLDAFSTEILSFDKVTIKNINALNNLDVINYLLKCDLDYDNGREYINEKSVLHLIPGSQFTYR